VDVDHDALAVRLRHFCELQRVGTAELDDLNRPHGATPYGPASASWQEAPPLHARIAASFAVSAARRSFDSDG